MSLLTAGSAFAQTQPAAPKPARLEPPGRGGNIIKTIQRKNFLKVKRFELGGFVGGETIDPFIRHWVGGITGAYHFTEVFALEGLIGASPYLGDADLKDLTVELAQTASVKPRSSKMRYYGSADLMFSPLYGKMAFLSNRIINFDLYFMTGMGVVNTRDLDEDYAGNPIEFPTTYQSHFATNFGFGFRAAFNRWMALRLEGREYFYIESVTIGDQTYSQEVLNLKYYFIAQAGLSFFFPTTLH
jgi:outer membrane beta-barrel protein